MLPRNPYLDKEFRKRHGIVYKHEDGSQLTDAEVEVFWGTVPDAHGPVSKVFTIYCGHVLAG